MGEAGWRGGVPERSGAVWGAARVILGEGASGTVQGRRGGPGRWRLVGRATAHRSWFACVRVWHARGVSRSGGWTTVKSR